MPRRPATTLSAVRADELRGAFDALLAEADLEAHKARDPVRFVHRYNDPADQEVAACIAGMLAYGKVTLFPPVIEAILAQADSYGGPRDYVESFDRTHTRALEPLYYRWNRHPDFALWLATLGVVVRQHGRLGAVLEAAHDPGDSSVRAAFATFIDTLRRSAVVAAEGLGIEAESYPDLPRGFRTFLPEPGASSCKRWNMVLRWMVRTADGIDLGIWALPPRCLVLPLDTHTHRLSRYIGLTARKDASWRTAEEITDNLARIDPEDPVRYDFALAHLGISGACERRYRPRVCPACPLLPVCKMARH